MRPNSKIPKEQFEKVYYKNSNKTTAQLLGISLSKVAELARIYDVHKNNTMR